MSCYREDMRTGMQHSEEDTCSSSQSPNPVNATGQHGRRSIKADSKAWRDREEASWEAGSIGTRHMHHTYIIYVAVVGNTHIQCRKDLHIKEGC